MRKIVQWVVNGFMFALGLYYLVPWLLEKLRQ